MFHVKINLFSAVTVTGPSQPLALVVPRSHDLFFEVLAIVVADGGVSGVPLLCSLMPAAGTRYKESCVSRQRSVCDRTLEHFSKANCYLWIIEF